jgi:hypothetical protein
VGRQGTAAQGVRRTGVVLEFSDVGTKTNASARSIAMANGSHRGHVLKQLLKSLIPIKPYPTLKGFKTVFAELAEKVPAAKTANPKDFVDTRFLEEFDRSGFIDGMYK